MTVRSPPWWVTVSGGPSIAESSSRAGPLSAPTTLTVPPTSRTWSVVTGSSKVSFRGASSDHSDGAGIQGLPESMGDAIYRVSAIHDISRALDVKAGVACFAAGRDMA